MPATAPSPRRSVSASTASPATTDAASCRPARTCSRRDATEAAVLGAQARHGYAGADGNHLILVATPRTTSRRQYRKNYPDTFSFVINSNADTSPKCRPSARGRSVEPAAEDRPSVRADPSLKPR